MTCIAPWGETDFRNELVMFEVTYRRTVSPIVHTSCCTLADLTPTCSSDYSPPSLYVRIVSTRSLRRSSGIPHSLRPNSETFIQRYSCLSNQTINHHCSRESQLLQFLSPASHPNSATLLGWHAEGPFLQHEKRGAHMPGYLLSAPEGRLFRSF
jgi:hypothetical protein